MNGLKSCLWLVALMMFAGCSSTSTYRIADAGVAPDRIVSLWIPVMLEPLTIDGRTVPGDLVPTAKRYRYELTSGAHEVVVRYSGFTDVPEQMDVVRSLPVSVAMNGIPGHHYLLEYDDHDNQIRLGKKEIRPDVSVVDITTNTALIGSWTGSTRPGQSPDAPKPAAPVKGRANVATATSTSISTSESVSPGILAQLQQSWQQAGESERGEFMQWTVLQAKPSAALSQLQEAWQKASDSERGEFLKWTTLRK